MALVEHLALADVVDLAAKLEGKTPAAVQPHMNLAAVHRALLAPAAALDGRTVHRDLTTKAAVLCARLVEHPPLAEQQLPLAWLCMREFLARNGRELLDGDPDEVHATLGRVASGELMDADLAFWIESQLAPTARRLAS
jgi:hypothetical protein